MRFAWLAALPMVFAGGFHSCVESLPPQAAQSDPSWFARRTDLLWRRLTLTLVDELQSRRARSRAEWLAALAALPQGAADEPEDHDEELATSGSYGRLPEVITDQVIGAIFPVPLSRPQRYSWYQASHLASETLDELERFDRGLARWRGLAPAERLARAAEVSGAWDSLESHAVLLARHVRYLDTWVPQLTRQWVESRSGSRPVQYQLTDAIQHGDPRLMGPLRELLRPARVLKRPFLPKEIENAVVTLPIATDVASRRFLAEVDGALATHWNQSAWAREQGARFEIRWVRVPRDEGFARGARTLDEHLARFPRDMAAMTTGGLSTYVRGQALVLGPGKINPRTLAHELGHLMGFADCYLRTLSGQGVLGTAVLEWDNPLYPDDLMCDNTVGAVRAEVW